MIEFTKAYVVDGRTYANLRDAQVATIQGLFKKEPLQSVEVAETLLASASTVIDTLSMTERSKPKARATHGGTKKRKGAALQPVQTT